VSRLLWPARRVFVGDERQRVYAWQGAVHTISFLCGRRCVS
jgi:superfamily I DNA/RNA helicase